MLYNLDTQALKTMDFLMRFNSPGFLMGGANVLEKLGHALHMQEMWAGSAKLVEQLKQLEVSLAFLLLFGILYN